jgi:SPOR domain
VSATTLTRRRTKAVAEQQATKERRQKIFIVGALFVLIVVLAFELPTLLGGGGSSGTSSGSEPAAAPAPVAAAPSAPVANPAALRAALKHPAHDPFALKRTQPGPNTLGSVPTPPGLHDPFAARSTPEAAIAPPAPKPVVVAQLPGTIVIGTAGAGRVAEKGWIVILASIPTSKGQRAATAFASSARGKGLTTVSLLNSSNRRPLRGGYWVVYTGPYGSLAAVNKASSTVHGKGFSTAYIRELIVYKQKAK